MKLQNCIVGGTAMICRSIHIFLQRKGQALTEYVIIISVASIAALAVLTSIGVKVDQLFYEKIAVLFF